MKYTRIIEFKVRTRTNQKNLSVLDLPGADGARKLSNAFDLANQSELLAISFSRSCLALACSASILSRITASGIELQPITTQK